MFLAGRNQVMLKRSLTGTMRKFKEMGYEGIEIQLVRGLTDILALDYLDDYVIDKVNEVSEEISLPVTALSCHQNYVTHDLAFEAQKLLIKKARKYKTDVVIVSTFIPFELREGRPEVYDRLYTRTKELCRIAEEYGVKFAIEVEPNQLFHNLRIFFDMAEKVKSSAFKLNFDIGHMYLSEVDIIGAIDRAKDFIVYSHIENMCMGEHCHKVPWEGEIDLLSAYRHLKETCYDGAVSLDVYLQDYEEISPKCIEWINENVFSKI